MEHKYKIGDWIIGPNGYWYRIDDINEQSYCLLNIQGRREINSIESIDKSSFRLSVHDIMTKMPKWKKATDYIEFKSYVAILEDNRRVVLSKNVNEGEYYLFLSDLIELPKEV